MRDIAETLERWVEEGRRVAVATVVERRGSAPRDVGASLALNDAGAIAGSVTGGCVEPAVIREAQAVLEGEGPRLQVYGISDEDAFQVGLACGGTVAIFVHALDAPLALELAAAIRADEAIALEVRLSDGRQRVAPGGHSESGLVDRDTFVHAFAPRPAMYVFGAIDHAAALTRVGKLLGYRVTVCDARSAFVTRDRFPEADELVVDWPDRFLQSAPVDERTAICVLTHDPKFDVPALVAALDTPAAYIGAMGSRKTTADREERLRAAGVGDAALARIHAPIGLAVGARSPEEVAVAIGAQIVEATRKRAPEPAVSLLA
jgi:xanthine dehydrogenase accessory factor